MQKYEILPHTADISIRATGSTKEEIVEVAMQGMFDVAEPRYIEGTIDVKRAFSITAPDFQSLLVDILNEAIYFSDKHHEAYSQIKWEHLDGSAAKGIFIGKSVTGFETQIKAATHHNLSIKKQDDGSLQAVIVFDA